MIRKNDSNGIWTRVTAVKGRCLNHLTMEPCFFDRFTVLLNSPSWARTSDNTVNSRALYQLSYRGSFFLFFPFSFEIYLVMQSISSVGHVIRDALWVYLQNYIQNVPSNLLLTFPWLKPRPISNSQLHTLPHFHLCPIYLVVFKGSY